jgi:hypothetical protein
MTLICGPGCGGSLSVLSSACRLGMLMVPDRWDRGDCLRGGDLGAGSAGFENEYVKKG